MQTPTTHGIGQIALPQRGEIFDGKFRIDGVLGVDGMGALLAATRLGRGEPVAIKVLLPDAMGDAGLVARSMREGRASSKIRSDHVARAAEVGLFHDRPYLVIEYLPGEHPSALVDEGGIHRNRSLPRAAERAAARPPVPVMPVAPAHSRRSSVPAPPMRSAAPGYLLAGVAFLGLLGTGGWAVWHQSRSLHAAEMHTDPPTLAPQVHVPPVPKLAPAATDAVVTTTGATVSKGAVTEVPPAPAAEPVAPFTASTLKTQGAVTPAPPPVHHHHHARPQTHAAQPAQSTRAAASSTDDDANPYATSSATSPGTPDPAEGNHLFEVRK